jgi:hypothetical protein
LDGIDVHWNRLLYQSQVDASVDMLEALGWSGTVISYHTPTAEHM